MGIRDMLDYFAYMWVGDAGSYKPTAEELVSIFDNSGAEASPTIAEAKDALVNRLAAGGVVMGGQEKHWCGVFATQFLRDLGADVSWTLLGGKVKGGDVVLRPGLLNMRPGDIAMIPRSNHHFLILDVDYSAGTLTSLDGNAEGQTIRTVNKNLKTGAANTTIYGYYQLQR